MATIAVDRIIRKLARVEADAPVVVSCYLRLDVQFRQRKMYLGVLKERARTLLAHLPARALSRDDLNEVRADIGRVLEWASRPDNLPGLPGVAVFACKRLGVFEVVPLPRAHRVRLEADYRPLLSELLDARERLQHYLAVVVDRERARFFEIAADSTTEVQDVIANNGRGGRYRSDRRDSPGWGEKHYHNRVTSQIHRHYAYIAEEAGRLLRERQLGGVAIMGPSVHAKAMAEFLPDGLRKVLLGTASLNPTVDNPSKVSETTWLLQAAREKADEVDLVETVEQAVPKGAAVNGIRDTLRALSKGQVRTLLVPEGQDGAGFRCTDSGRLVLTRAHCRGEGDPIVIANLIDAAIDEALRQRADVRVIDDPDQAARIDGLAATLRFRDK